MKNQSFFEIYDSLKMKAVEDLIKEAKNKRRWRMLGELMQYKEELNGVKNAV